MKNRVSTIVEYDIGDVLIPENTKVYGSRVMVIGRTSDNHGYGGYDYTIS